MPSPAPSLSSSSSAIPNSPVTSPSPTIPSPSSEYNSTTSPPSSPLLIYSSKLRKRDEKGVLKDLLNGGRTSKTKVILT
ncbi:hypothetical protein V2J09_011686 [Rumex salicifolius]